jgi:SAM-dependent methyltransferase
MLLDIDPAGEPDVVCDARKLGELPAAQFDAIYCSHNLEHYYRHDARKVLQGFRNVLKADGFAEIRVPDLRSVIQRYVAADLDIEDVLYESQSGPISVHDVIYGWGLQIERSGVDFYAHKAGFTARSLGSFLLQAGFSKVLIAERPEAFEISALAFMQDPTEQQCALLGI